MTKRFGTTMSGVERSKRRKQRDAKKRREEEKAWAAKSGPVKTYVDPDRMEGAGQVDEA